MLQNFLESKTWNFGKDFCSFDSVIVKGLLLQLLGSDNPDMSVIDLHEVLNFLHQLSIKNFDAFAFFQCLRFLNELVNGDNLQLDEQK